MNKMLNTNKESENVNKQEFFKTSFPHKSSIQKQHPMALLNFWLIFIAKDEFLQNSCDFWTQNGFQGLWPLRSKFFNHYCDQWLVPSLDKNFEKYCWDCWDGISQLSHWYTQLLLIPEGIACFIIKKF